MLTRIAYKQLNILFNKIQYIIDLVIDRVARAC